MGQEPPGLEPRVFAPGFISTGMPERDVAMTPNGKELYYCVQVGNYAVSQIVFTRQVDGTWTEPEVVPFASRYMDLEPAISPDGSRLFFMSNRPGDPAAEGPGSEDIWVVDRTGSGWSEPRNLGPPVNSDSQEFFPSLTRDGTLYFTRREEGGAEAIYRSRLVEGAYQQPERLPASVNSGSTQFNAFIDPDERFIILSVMGRKDSLGGPDYYVVFRAPDDTWSDPVNLGGDFNTPRGREWSPYVSPDGKYFFFMSSRSEPSPAATYDALVELHNRDRNGYSDIWWADAEVIHRLKPEGF